MIEPQLPKVERRARHPGRKRHPDRLVFQVILFVLHTGIAWEHLPQELGFHSGMTCWRRLAVRFSSRASLCGCQLSSGSMVTPSREILCSASALHVLAE